MFVSLFLSFAHAAFDVSIAGFSRRCAATLGGYCSVSKEEVAAGTIISDKRPVDGNLKVDIENNRTFTFTFTSGFSPKRIQYFLTVNGEFVELKPDLNFQGK